MTMRCFEVRLTIPDNEAYTALATLRRLAVPVARLERADLYRCEIDDTRAPSLAQELRACEALFNPNKHVLAERPGDAPGPGEVWVEAADGTQRVAAPVTFSGRTLAGVRSLERWTAWRLASDSNEPVAGDVVVHAARALLCNPAFQIARFTETLAR